MAVSGSACYAWAKTPGDTDKTRQKAALEAEASELYNNRKQTYGYRRLSKELDKVGIKSGYYQVRHLMARLGLKARYPKRFKVTTGSNHNAAISSNSLDRHKGADNRNLACSTTRIAAANIPAMNTVSIWLS